jgi:hypothetical protein
MTDPFLTQLRDWAASLAAPVVPVAMEVGMAEAFAEQRRQRAIALNALIDIAEAAIAVRATFPDDRQAWTVEERRLDETLDRRAGCLTCPQSS